MNFLFKGFEHVFKALKHMYKGLGQVFQALEHKFPLRVRKKYSVV